MKPLFLSVAAIILSIGAIPAQAQKITPSHVYQAADNMVLELRLLADANFTDTSVPNIPIIPGKRPRHVIQKGQEILRQLETLTWINGRQMGTIEPIPVIEITPGNVLRPVSRALQEIRGLKSAFRVDGTDTNAPFINGKTPSDVYARLTQASILIGRLGIPKPVPNDVYRSAQAIVADMERVATALSISKPATLGETFTGRSPSHVYVRARHVLMALRRLVKSNTALAIPGGVTLPPEMTGKITPGDVLEVQNTILAEISSIKVKAGATTPTPTVAPPSGKTPSAVYGATNDALLYVQAFLDQDGVQDSY